MKHILYLLLSRVILLKNKSTQLFGVLLCILSGALWGFSGVCGEYMINSKGAVSAWIVPWRLLIAGIILTAYNFIRHGYKKTLGIWCKKLNVIDLILTGVLGIMACQFTYCLTIEYSNAGIATVLQYISPIIIMIVVCITVKRFPQKHEVAALILAILGVFTVSTHFDFSQLAIPLPALIIGLISAMTVVIYNLAPVRLMREYPPEMITGWGMLLSGITLMPLFRPWQYDIKIDIGIILAMFGMTVLGSVLSFTFYYISVKIIGPTKASIFASSEPITAMLVSAVWLGTKFTLLDIIGMVLIFVAIIVLTVIKEPVVN